MNQSADIELNPADALKSLRKSNQQSARAIHLAEMKQQGVVSFRQIEYPRIRLCVPRLDRFQDVLVLGLVAQPLWYSVKHGLIGGRSDKVVLPIGGAFVD